MVRENNVGEFYQKLRIAAFHASTSPVWIFPSANDVDSLCALKIFTRVLQSDSVRYSAYPVAASNDINELLKLSLDRSDRSLVVLLINWGASCNLLQLLNPGPHVKIFVVDSHRPIHLLNLSRLNTQVTVLYTGEDENQADMYYGFDIEELADYPDLGSDLDESDEESDEDDDDEDTERRRNRRRRTQEADESEDREVVRLRKNKAAYYGKGSFHGIASGYLMHEMSHASHKNNNENLWMACVALTDQFVHERISNERYLSNFMTLEQHIRSAGHLDVAATATLKDGTKVRVPDVMRIKVDEEPRLMLLREWTLFDSMVNSSYTSTKLKTWTDRGMYSLKLLLANMGIAVTEAQQQFPHMKTETRNNLKSMFEQIQASSGFTDLYYRSFQRFHGYNPKVSAADVVFGVSAILESYVEATQEHGSYAFANQFWDAYMALNADSLRELVAGMHLAIKVQRAIHRQGCYAIMRREIIRSTRAFRYLILDMTPETELLAHPLSLTRFCYFLMDALRELGHPSKPILCSAPIPGDPKSHVIVGVSQRLRIGAQHGNKFGLAFRTVAQNLGAQYSGDAFESSWIRLKKEDVTSFMLEIPEL
ncbi:hypothetical protein AXG93_1660s1240 [Marchantia polymorpha subsp. ruderalis]|uniref:Cell division control protein 45 n=1 Tax=Marchantia polymorpha subsp. ruderalis TaxID=1480154 RepID=A0A176VTC9_MARPO|nr:hypothetical protein AXG93_1660s1240 [Marchantia polymorpha subsp. ruderalis]